MKPQSETRERFMQAIADRVTRDAIEGAHFFQPIKQGGLESGVAVVAVREADDKSGARSAPAEHPIGDEAAAENAPSGANARLAVYTAQYRLTLKGPERGKWEFSIKAEADAPLVTVETVVRGVQRRSGDAEEPTRLVAEELRDFLPAPAADAGLPPAAATGTMG